MTEQPQIDPRDIVAAFRERVSQLVQCVREWTARDPSLQVDTTDHEIEDVLGRYTITRATVHRRQMSLAHFIPLSAAVIGAQGRIDVDGPSDRGVLLYLEGAGTIETRVGTPGSDAIANRAPIFRGVSEPGWYWISDARSRDVRLLDAAAFRALIATVADYEIP